MGFRELSKFNEALLAKQVWRLIHNKSSLLYKVLHAKYFPSGSVMEARCSSRASFAWKSILSARKVIQTGARWRIGRGESTRIWRDKWILPPSSGLPLSPPNFLDAEARVSSLIQQSSGTWNSNLIDQVFLPGDADLIKSIPLSTRLSEDALVWSRKRMENSRFAVLIECCQRQRVLPSKVVLTWVLGINIGNLYGQPVYLIKSVTFYGVRV
jgi:hypothetical protein